MNQYFDMSPLQRNIFSVAKAYEKTGLCNIGGLLYMEKCQDPDLLIECARQVVVYNGALRLRIGKNNKLYEQPQISFNKESWKMMVYDFNNKSEEEYEEILQAWFQEPMCLYDSNLFEFILINRNNEYYIYEKFHHLIADGAAIVAGIQKHELIYKNLADGSLETIQDDDRFITLIKESQKAEDYMKEEAKNWFAKDFSTSEFGRSSINVGKNPKAVRTYYHIKNKQLENMRIFSDRNKISVEYMLYAALYYYITRTTGTNRAVIGRVMANRKRKEMDMMGMTVNTLPVLVTLEEEISYLALCRQIKSKMIALSKYLDYSYHTLAKDLQIKEILYDMAVTYRPMKYLPLPEDGVCTELFSGYSEIPLKIAADDYGEYLELRIDYRTENYTKEEMDYFINRIINIMSSGCLDIFTQSDKQAVTHFNDTNTWKFKQSIPEKFRQQSERNPDKTSLIFGQQKVSFSEVQKYVDKVAAYLLDLKIAKGQIVGIQMERDIYMPITMMAILQAGAAFLPISVNESVERTKAISALCSIVFTKDQVRSIFSDEGIWVNKPGTAVIMPEDTAYCMFTSGTTGAPKAVQISHKSLSARLEWMADTFGVDQVVLQKTTNIFDVSVWELLMPMAFGMTMCLLEPNAEKYPDIIADTIQKNHITMVHFVPTMLSAFLEYIATNHRSLDSLTNMICSGETLKKEQADVVHRLLPGVSLYNLYGPTECTIDVSSYECTFKEDRIPIGRPLYNTKLLVVNQRKEILPPGVEGELLITGDLVGKGYFDVKDNSKRSAFINWNGEPGYLSGDIVTLGYNNQLYYLGRNDNQIKLRGMRIDISEIESVMLSHKNITGAVVVNKGRSLIGVYSAKQDVQLKEYLVQHLPYYLVPMQMIKIDEIPINKNGKADKEKILEYAQEVQKIEKGNGHKNNGRREQYLQNVIGDFIGSVGVGENLLEKGLDSLSIINIVTALNQEGVDIEFGDFYRTPTIEALAGKMHQRRRSILFLKREEKNRKRLILCIPYGGGKAESFYSLKPFIKGWDIAAVNHEFFNWETTIEEMAVNIRDEINEKDSYHEILLVGFCIGTALTLELGRTLGLKIVGMILCESLPFTGVRIHKQIVTPWDVMGEKSLNRVLSLLHGRDRKMQIPQKELCQFKSDVKKSVKYMKKQIAFHPNYPVTLVFGKKDYLTTGYKRKYRRWHKWIKTEFKIVELPKMKHFILERDPKKMARIINRQLKSLEHNNVKEKIH